jgi:hypothetical protein
LTSRALHAVVLSCIAFLLVAAEAGAQPILRAIPNPVPVTDALFGTAVAGLGDVNGDGVGDLAVSALGQAKVFLHSGSDLSVIRTLSDPDGLADMRFGLAVAAVGDQNGDGVEDVAVGSPGDDLTVLLPCVDPNVPCVAQPYQGRAFVFSGATGALIRRLLPPGNEFLAFGFSFAAIGDLDGDGKSEIAVGSPTRRNNRFGQVFAFRSSNGSVLWQRAEPSTQALASFGQVQASIDDVNGDGVRDILVDAPFHDYDPSVNGFLLAGRAYLLSGATGTILRSHDNPSPAANERFGLGLTGLADETGDGIDEYALGDPVAGAVFVHRGNDGALLRSIASPGTPATDGFGSPLVRVDDEDGDGRDDFWAAASRGGVIYRMNSLGAVLAQVIDPTPGAVPPNGGFGSSLAATADLNGDGKRDVVVGEPAEPAAGRANAGAAYLVVGNRPPLAKCRPVTKSADASCSADMTAAEVDDGSFDPDGDPIVSIVSPAGPFALGITPVTLTATDDKGATAMCGTAVTVVDTTPPSLSPVAASPAVLWPPNHKLVRVAIQYSGADNCSLPAAIACALDVASNEPADGIGDGHTTPDWVVTDAHRVQLRSERSGGGGGRIYSVAVECRDEAMNGVGAGVDVVAPHHR